MFIETSAKAGFNIKVTMRLAILPSSSTSKLLDELEASLANFIASVSHFPGTILEDCCGSPWNGEYVSNEARRHG